MKKIAIIAHDAKKDEMVQFVSSHIELFKKFKLVATATTGERVATVLGLSIEKKLSGPLGGDLQIGAEIAEGHIRAVFFLRDPLSAHAHEPDINALLKVCDVYRVPLATNLGSAEALIKSL